MVTLQHSTILENFFLIPWNFSNYRMTNVTFAHLNEAILRRQHSWLTFLIQSRRINRYAIFFPKKRNDLKHFRV